MDDSTRYRPRTSPRWVNKKAPSFWGPFDRIVPPDYSILGFRAVQAPQQSRSKMRWAGWTRIGACLATLRPGLWSGWSVCWVLSSGHFGNQELLRAWRSVRCQTSSAKTCHRHFTPSLLQNQALNGTFGVIVRSRSLAGFRKLSQNLLLTYVTSFSLGHLFSTSDMIFGPHRLRRIA